MILTPKQVEDFDCDAADDLRSRGWTCIPPVLLDHVPAPTFELPPVVPPHVEPAPGEPVVRCAACGKPKHPWKLCADAPEA